MKMDIDDEHVDVLHELLLRGIDSLDEMDREHGDALDAFLESTDSVDLIGNHSDRVKEAWKDALAASDANSDP